MIQIILPSGNILNYPIKHMITLIFSFMFLIAVINIYKNKKLLINKYIFYFISIFLILSFWILVSVINGFEISSALQEYSFFIVYILVFIYFIFLIKYNFISTDELKNWLLIILLVYAIVKIIIEIIIFTEIINIAIFLALYEYLFGLKLSTLQIFPEGFWRINSANDIILIIYTSFLIINFSNFRFNIFLKYIFLFLLLAGVYFTYSRFGFLTVILSYIIFLLLNPKKIYTHLILLFLFFLTLSSNEFLENINKRFNSNETSNSNEIKQKQINSIKSSVEQNIIFGLGLGSHMKDYVRSDVSKFSYEAQIPSFWFKLGTIGFILFLSSILSLYMFILSLYFNKYILFNELIKTSFLYLLFWGAGSINLYFTGVTCSITLAFIVFLSYNKINFKKDKTNESLISK